MKCGNCQEVCPIYKEIRQEVTVARGKISLVEMLLDGEADMTDGLIDRMSLCTTCMACNVKCPCGVRFDQIILAARAEGVRQKGMHPLKNIIFKTLKRQPVFNAGMRAGSAFQGVVFRRVAGQDYGARMRINAGLDKQKVFPRLASKPFRAQKPVLNPAPNPKHKVAFFIGCMINYFYPDMGEAVLDVLNHNNVDVVILKKQGCCGVPASVNGDVASARTMAVRNLQALEESGVDYLVVSCSSCGSAWKHSYADLWDDESSAGESPASENIGSLAALARKWAARTYDINEFLVNVISYDRESLGPLPRRITYHDPCHLNRGQGITSEPRAILRSIPELELTEMSQADRCCGMAGSFCIMHPKMSDQILARKIEIIAKTRADTIATGCPACRLQLKSGIINAGLEQDSVHVVQLLAESYQRGKTGS
jgi:glycolate oxidase iron-sulfur subunit